MEKSGMKLMRIMLVVVLLVVGFSSAYSYVEKKVTRIELPKGNLKWTNVRPENARICIPAAFTDTGGNVSGAYRYDSKTYQNGKAMKMRVSMKGESFYISRNWLSDNGFQQLTLVCDSKAMKFVDSRRSFRRALCKDGKSTFILQSNYPMTLNEFAVECRRCSTNATYLDMGEYGYGYVKTNNIVRPLFVWGIFTKGKQTNWIYIE